MRLNKQRGVAVITALLLCTLAVSIVASLFWQQQVQVRSMENQRLQLQTKWILRGALDWARLVLQTAGQQNNGVTTLNDVWNTPLAETRLDQYIERERIEGEVFDATLSGRVIDASSRYNLRHLSEGPKPSPAHVEIYANLLRVLQIDPALAKRTADYIVSTEPPPPIPGQTSPPAKSIPVQIKRVEDLMVVPGYTPEIIAKLRDFVIVLPSPTGTADKPGLNINTAPPEVLAAVIRNFSLSEAQTLAAARKTAYFRTKDEFKARLNTGKDLIDEASIAVGSEFFLVQSRIRLDRANLDSEALVERQSAGATTVLTIRQN